jgi:hypothetical protein
MSTWPTTTRQRIQTAETNQHHPVLFALVEDSVLKASPQLPKRTAEIVTRAAVPTSVYMIQKKGDEERDRYRDSWIPLRLFWRLTPAVLD